MTINRRFIYRGRYRHLLLVYKVACSKTGKFYIGNTQQNLKKHIDTHLSESCSMVNKNEVSDSFVRHFATQFSTEAKITIMALEKDQCRNYMARKTNFVHETLQETNMYVMHERTTIDSYSPNKVYGACRHKTKCHRYDNSILFSADERHQGLKGIDETNNKKLTSPGTICTNKYMCITRSSISSSSQSELTLTPITDITTIKLLISPLDNMPRNPSASNHAHNVFDI